MKAKTISQVLEECELKDVLTDGTRTWKITTTNFDGFVVASPYKWDKDKMGSPFELWTGSLEKVSFIPGLKKKGKKK